MPGENYNNISFSSTILVLYNFTGSWSCSNANPLISYRTNMITYVKDDGLQNFALAQGHRMLDFPFSLASDRQKLSTSLPIFNLLVPATSAGFFR